MVALSLAIWADRIYIPHQMIEQGASFEQRVDLLTDSQVEALILSLLGQTSKSIAISMSQRGRQVSHHTVDSWIRKALPTLGVQTRDEAAQIVGRSQRALQYQELISQASPVVQRHLDATPMPSRGEGGSNQDWAGTFGTGWPFPTRERPQNDDSLVWRVLWPIIIAIMTIFAFTALYAVLRGWSDMSSGR